MAEGHPATPDCDRDDRGVTTAEALQETETVSSRKERGIGGGSPGGGRPGEGYDESDAAPNRPR